MEQKDLSRLVLPDRLLPTAAQAADLAGKMHGLLQQQKSAWELLGDGYAALDGVESRALSVDGLTVHVHWNPGRITSTSALVDDDSIRQRQCFLCPAALPEAQRGLSYESEYLIFGNPYPIFPEHFTIAHFEHRPQRIGDVFDHLLHLARDLHRRYIVFYNGPRCGASAPDHLHFQAGTKAFLPIETEYMSERNRFGARVAGTPRLRVYGVTSRLRRFIAFESRDARALQEAFGLLSALLREHEKGDDEPMMNVLASFDNGEWRVLVLPRRAHRPSFYFAEGEGRILISPAAVDLGGVVITPREEDYRKVKRDTIVQMIDEVCFAPSDMAELCQTLAKAITASKTLR
jgi:ATP adenylyltransferase/5',5'''-P-1,P-4-tetraphosphate phosphorylase II